jgi:glycerol-3-phosphate acyltransferase PlsX
VRIALDAMGTDRHPAVEVQGAVQALSELANDFCVVLVGDEDRINEELKRAASYPADRLEVVHAASWIDPAEAPATAVRRKPDSSIVVGLTLQREGKADAFVSAGSTGAVMAASLFILRPLPGVDRPAVAPLIPTRKELIVLVDGGANIDCKPHHLLQFAQLGAIYAEDVLQRPHPRVGLLNIGEEPEKGNELAVETHRLLRSSNLNFVGNVEGRDIVNAPCDVLVTDGFVGNVLLKFYESVAGFVSGLVNEQLEASGVHVKFEELCPALDYTQYGGAHLLGVNGLSMICHGGSPPHAIRNAIRSARQAVQSHMLGHMRQELAAGRKPQGTAAGAAER